jgi:hypothetical protein
MELKKPNLKPYKDTNDAYVDLYKFFKVNIGIKFSARNLRDITKLNDTNLKTALRNLYIRRLIIKEKNMQDNDRCYMYYYDTTCYNMDD